MDKPAKTAIIGSPPVLGIEDESAVVSPNAAPLASTKSPLVPSGATPVVVVVVVVLVMAPASAAEPVALPPVEPVEDDGDIEDEPLVGAAPARFGWRPPKGRSKESSEIVSCFSSLAN